jgi:hypothetical protein
MHSFVYINHELALNNQHFMDMKKRTLQLVAALALTLVGNLSAWADDGDHFDALAEGAVYEFRVISEADATVAYALDSKGRSDIWKEGNIKLPTQVKYNGKTYSVIAIDPGAFMNNTKLTGLTISGEIKTIGDRAFYGCKNIKTLLLKEGIEKMGDQAFCDCDMLEEVNIPKSMRDAGEGPFADCDYLKSITCTSGGYYYTIGPMLCKGNKLVQFPSGASYFERRIDGHFVVCFPESITQIGKWAIVNTGMHRVYIHEKVKFVDLEAVSDLETVYLTWDENTIEDVVIAENSFSGITFINVPMGTLNCYKNLNLDQNAEFLIEWDEELGPNFCGKSVKRSECENITHNVTSGKVSYDRFNKLFIVENAVIDAGYNTVFDIWNRCNGIELHGANSITCRGLDAIIVRNDNSCIISGIEYWKKTKKNPKLIITTEARAIFLRKGAEVQWESVEFQFNCSGNTNVVYGEENSGLYMYDSPGGMRNTHEEKPQLINIWGDFYWSGTYISDPPGAEWVKEWNSICYQGTTTPVTSILNFVESGDVVEGITIGGQMVTSSNVPYLEKGTLTWDADNQKLTLNNATINVPNGEGLRIATGVSLDVKGTNTITSKGNAITILDGDSEFSGTGTLKVKSTEGYGLVYDYYLDFASGNYDIYGKLGAIDGTSRRGFIGDFVVNCPLRVSSDGKHAVLRNVNIPDNSTACTLNWNYTTANPDNCYFISTPNDAYYDAKLQTICHVDSGAVKQEIVYKKGSELNYVRYPLSIGNYPVSNLNCHQIVKGVSYTPNGTDDYGRECGILTLSGDIEAWSGFDAIRVEEGLPRLNIFVNGFRTVKAKASNNTVAGLHIAGEDTYVNIYDSRQDKNGASNLLMGCEDGYGILMDQLTHLKFYSIGALVRGIRAVDGNEDSSYLTLEHSTIYFIPDEGRVHVIVHSFDNNHSVPLTPNVTFSYTQHRFVNEQSGEIFLGGVTYQQKHPTVWIGGQQVDCPQPSLGEGNTGMAYYDFDGDVLTLQDAHIENPDGPALRYLCDDTWHMQTDTYMRFSGDCYLKGSTAGILVEGVYDEEHETEPYFYMGFEGLHEDGSDKLTVESEGRAIYWKSPEGGEFGFYDLNLDVTGDGAFYGAQATSDYYDIKSLNFYNCNVSAKNNQQRNPTIGYFGDFYLKDCYLLSANQYLDDVRQSICDGNGHVIYDNIRIIRGERGDEPLGIDSSWSEERGVRSEKFYFEGTGVRGYENTHSSMYNLQGQRVGSDYKPGIYILNGKKVVRMSRGTRSVE